MRCSAAGRRRDDRVGPDVRPEEVVGAAGSPTRAVREPWTTEVLEKVGSESWSDSSRAGWEGRCRRGGGLESPAEPSWPVGAAAHIDSFGWSRCRVPAGDEEAHPDRVDRQRKRREERATN